MTGSHPPDAAGPEAGRAALPAALRAGLAQVRAETIQVRRDLHAHPELAFQEHRTAALIARRCAALGLRVRTGVAETGVLADLDSGRPGPTVLVRADMDALPVPAADDGRPYRSTVAGVMHACGHDGHVAVALAVAELLVALGPDWAGRVRLCFQPAEETDLGAARMIEAGALAGVDVAVGLHLQAGLETGTVAIGSGVQWASSDELHLSLCGPGGHAGEPGRTPDPVAAAAEVILELERRARASPGTVLTVAQVNGGTAANVIPERVTMVGTLRALADLDRMALRQAVAEVADRVARARGVTAELGWAAECPAVVCDPQVTAEVRDALAATMPPGRVAAGEASTTCDDMARYLRLVPGCYFRVGASDPAAGPPVPHHHPSFDLDERSLEVATRALTTAVLALLR